MTDTLELPMILRAGEGVSRGVSPRALQRDAERGDVVRIRRGAYVDAKTWRSSGRDVKRLLHIVEVVESRRMRPVLCGASAAAVLGLPLVGVPVDTVHLLAEGGAAPPNSPGVTWHRRNRRGPIVEVGGFLVTDVETTVVDLARALRFIHAVAPLDHALRSGRDTAGIGVADGQLCSVAPSPMTALTTEGLLDRLSAMRGYRGIASARRSIEFADARAESPGESLSRAQMHVAGFPEPDLQVRFDREDGGVDISDFDWPDFGLAGEFDGRHKYYRAELMGGRTPEDVVWDERVRERRIKRRHGRDMARWIWDDAWGLAGLREELLAAGLPIVRRRL